MSKPFAYYNEIDPFAAAWLNALIDRGVIANGIVDNRDIADVDPDDLKEFTQCHFFAGIGGWSYALRLAGWPDDRPVWTGSCPCQPFSTAGTSKGFSDDRHLWPVWANLIAICCPPVIFGEQVEAAIRHGWLDLVQDDLEGQDYAFAAVGLPGPCVGAFDIRQRLWFVADTNGGIALNGFRAEGRCADGNAGDAERAEAGELGDTGSAGLEKRDRVGRVQRETLGPLSRETTERRDDVSFWSDVEWIPCADGKARPIEPGTFPLAHGVPARVGRLRGYGNAIKPQVAAAFIQAYHECC